MLVKIGIKDQLVVDSGVSWRYGVSVGKWGGARLELWGWHGEIGQCQRVSRR